MLLDTFGSDYDTILSAWSGACGSLVSVDCNDDAGGTQSKLAFAVSAGENLTFLVSAYNGDGGDLRFRLDFQPPPATNDACNGATVITKTPFSDALDVIAAGVEPSDPAQSCAAPLAGTKSVFYRWTAPASGTMRADTLGSTYDTVLTAHTGDCGGLVESGLQR